MVRGDLRIAALGLSFLVAGALRAQTSETPAPAATPTAAPAAAEVIAPAATPAAGGSRAMIDALGACVESGRLNVEIDFVNGSYPAAPAWGVETSGIPRAAITTEASGGRVQKMDAAITTGQVLVRGKGLRPKVYVLAFSFENGKGVTKAKFRGKGIWRPIVSIFRGVAMGALRKLELNTDIPSVLRGEILGAKTPTPKPGAAPAPGPTPPPSSTSTASAAPTPGPSFLDLVDEVRIRDSAIVAFPGKPLALGEMVSFQTASHAQGEFPLRVTVDQGRFRPAHGGAAAKIELKGRVDGEIENGTVGFGGAHAAFDRGELRSGSYHLLS
ncbi:MAG TPA: hypothetical protein VIA45_03430, partial [Thermoanaerobaculia bacterium]